MNAANDLSKVSFHDCSLVGISQKEQSVFLALEDVDVEGVLLPMSVVIHDVEIVKRDNLMVKAINMETEDGEVISLVPENGQVTLAVSWHKHQPTSHITCIYGLFGPNVRLEIR